MSRLLSHFYKRTPFLRPVINSSRICASPAPLNASLRATYAATSFGLHPSPPRLPTEEQAEFERLQRSANTQEPLDPTAATTTPTQNQINPSLATKSALAAEGLRNENTLSQTLGETSNLPLRKGAPPEFEGEVNPKTGEVGGPKNEPLRWGSAGDWSFNGRVTDF